MGLFSKKEKIREDINELENDINIESKDIIENEDSIDINKLLEMCLDHFISVNPKTIGLVNRGQKTKESLYKDVKSFLNKNGASESLIEKVIVEFDKYIWGYGKLDDLINNSDDVSDIKILSKDNIRIKKLGKRMNADIKFRSIEELETFVNFVAIKNESSLADVNAVQILTDTKTSEKFILRINISSEFVNTVDNPYLHIRKIAKDKKDLDELERIGFCTPEEAKYLRRGMKKGLSSIFTGKGASGKTTLMNSLLDEIPFDKSGLVIQESEELFSNVHPDMMFQKVKYSKGEGKIQYTLKDLAINGLLIDLDYFIIGEIKGAEALYFLNACYTGHACLGSVHGNNSKEALNKLVDYMKYESDYSREELLSMVKDMDLIIYMKDFKVKEITEVSGFDYESKQIIYNTVFKDGQRIAPSCQKILDKIN